MRTTFVIRDGQLVEKRYAAPVNASPYVISDGMDATLNMANGQTYDSKRAYQKAVRAAGCEIVGNDPSISQPHRHQEMSDPSRDVRQAYEQLRDRR